MTMLQTRDTGSTSLPPTAASTPAALPQNWDWMLACASGMALGTGVAASAFRAFQVMPHVGSRSWLALFGAIGIFQGAALALLQFRVLRRRLPKMRAAGWITASALAASLGWLGAALVFGPNGLIAGSRTTVRMGVDAMFGIALITGALGGLGFGAAQAFALRRHARHCHRFIGSYIGGWAGALPILLLGAAVCRLDWSFWQAAAFGVGSGLLAGPVLGSMTSMFVGTLEPWVDEQRWSMHGKVCAVTGANRGIDFEVAKSFARMGAQVVLLCRDALEGQRAVDRIRAAVPGADLLQVQCDLSSLTSVEKASRVLHTRCNRLDVLVHNAGAVYAKRAITEDGLEATLAVDAIGPFLLTVSLLDRLEAARGRVIALAGIYQRRGKLVLDDLTFERRPYRWSAANAQAQLARFVLTSELARRSPLLFTASVHPGAVYTPLPATFVHTPLVWLRAFLRPFFVRAELGAQPVVRLAAEPTPSVPSGSFIDRFELTHDAADSVLAHLLWQKCEALVQAHTPAKQ